MGLTGPEVFVFFILTVAAAEAQRTVTSTPLRASSQEVSRAPWSRGRVSSA